MKKIRLFMTGLLLVMTSALFAQNITVTGTVTDASTGLAVPGVTVLLQGDETVWATTDDQGAYSINVPSNGTIVFSFLGYETVEMPVNGKAAIDVALKMAVQQFDEVVVVAFGTTTKEAFTGSATVVNEKKLERSQATSITNALAGAVPGVQLTSSNGAPGASSTIRIRGFSSVSAGNDPLIIVDGAPYSGDITNLSQSDIESMTVLKDAASNALYGARGANGVIMITTKKAKKGEALVTVDIKAGVNQNAMLNYNKLTDPAMFYETHYKALTNYYIANGMSPAEAMIEGNRNITRGSADGGLGYMVYDVPAGQYFIGPDGKINPNATLGHTVHTKDGDFYVAPDNWEDYAYRNGVRQEYTISVAGANDKASYYSAISYLGNDGITNNSDMERLTARLKADYQAKKWLKMGANFSYTHFNFNSLDNNGSSGSTGNIWAYTSQMAPIYPLFIRNADKTIKKDQWGFDMMDYGEGLNAGYARPFLADSNALSDTRFNTKNSEGNAATANGFFEIDIIKGLKVIINGNVNLDETRSKYIYNPYYGQFKAEKGLMDISHSRSISYNLQQILDFNRKFGKHNVGLMLGHEYNNDKDYILGASKANMFSQTNKELSGAVTDKQGAYSSMGEYNNEGYFLRALYDYDGRYYVSASYRRDASSRFHPDYRWGNFWSVGLSWIMSKEQWFNADWVDELKIKASIGSQGNDNIGNYRYTDLFDIVPSAGEVSTMFSTKGSKNITWETNRNINVGLEFGFINRIFGSIEYFDRTTTDMLYSFPVAPSMGYSSYWANVGDMRNYGAEFTLNFNIINKKNVSWDLNLNGTVLRNKITMLDPEKKTIEAFDADGNSYWGYKSGSMFMAEDLSLNTWYLREFAGVDQETGESLWYYDEKNEAGERTGQRLTTNEYSKADFYVSNKSAVAPFFGGFGTSLYAYGFDFSINCSYQIGGTLYDNGYAAAMSSPTSSALGHNFHVDLLDAWTPEKPSKTIPRFQYEDNYTAASSTRFFTKGSYLNIENINVGYSFPEKWMKKIGGEKCSLRLFFACENVWYWSARQGFDPRAGGGFANYAPMRTMSGGITVKF